MFPLVKYVGGKNRLVDRLVGAMPEKSEYFEPFVGSGVVAHEYLKNNSPGAMPVLGDTNLAAVSLLRSVRGAAGDVTYRLRQLTNDYDSFTRAGDYAAAKELYYTARDMFNRELLKEDYSEYELAALFIFLSRTCFNGLYRVNKNGLFNVPFGKYAKPAWPNLSDIRAAGAVFKNAVVYHAGFEFTLLSTAYSSKSMVYCDPPYDVLEGQSSYVGYSASKFDATKQEELANCMIRVDRAGGSFMVSNSDTPRIRSLYSGFNIQEVHIYRGLAAKESARKQLSELVITNYPCSL